MEKYITDKHTDLKYELVGDYYFVSGDDEAEKRPSGIWGCGCPMETSAKGRSTDRADRRNRWQQWYLKQRHKTVYADLLTRGRLNDYLADLNEQSEDMFFRLVKELVEMENITEMLKAKNQMLWIQKMNAIRATAIEIVNNELIFA